MVIIAAFPVVIVRRSDGRTRLAFDPDHVARHSHVGTKKIT